MSKTITYGTKKLTVLDQTNNQVPQTAHEIELQPDEKKAIAIGIEQNLPILLIGETGTGKTSIVRFLAMQRKQGYTRVNMNGHSTPDELIGSKSVKAGATYYEDGIVTKAMKEGHLCVLDEINATPPDCLFILHGLLDDDRRITLPNGDIITPHPDFRLIATMNPDYEGTKGINRALLDRFNIVLQIDVLTPKREQKLLVNREHVTEEDAERMIAVGTMARKSYQEQKTLTYVSTRSLLQWARLMSQGLNAKDAFQQSIVNKARENERPAFKDIYAAVFKIADNEDTALDIPTITTRREIKRLEQRNEELADMIMKRDTEIQELKQRLDKVKDLDQKLKEVEKEREAQGELRQRLEMLQQKLEVVRQQLTT